MSRSVDALHRWRTHSLRALDVDPRRLLDQAYAYGCLSAAWNADGEEEQRDSAIAAAIKQVRQTSY
ncbi:aminoglycoside phosphotransferase family protein [Salmonella enterica]|uniref:aminoglycoside phosphotransferase family protein n=1 Tax=Salmonella enterica TaxID=28901 RepID=UPI003CC82CF6